LLNTRIGCNKIQSIYVAAELNATNDSQPLWLEDPKEIAISHINKKPNWLQEPAGQARVSGSVNPANVPPFLDCL